MNRAIPSAIGVDGATLSFPGGTYASTFRPEGAKAGLLVRTIRYTPSKIGKVPTQVDYSDYRDVGGTKFPYQQTFTWLDGRDTFTFTDVKFNVPIDAAKFGEPVLVRGTR